MPLFSTMAEDNGCNTDYLPNESIEELLAFGFGLWDH